MLWWHFWAPREHQKGRPFQGHPLLCSEELPKMIPEAPKTLPRGAKTAPEGPRRAPREPRRGTKTLPRDFQDQHDSKLAPDNPSTAPNQSILSLLSSFFSPPSSILSCLFLLVSPVLSFLSSSLLGSTLFFFAMLRHPKQSNPQSRS